MTQLFRTWVALPPRVLHKNAKVCSTRTAMARNDAGKRYRAHVMVQAVKVLCGGFGADAQCWTKPRWPAASLRFTVYWPSRRRRDKDALEPAFSYAQDGLVDAGLLADDEHVTRLPTEYVIDPEDYAGAVCVEVWPVNGTAK